MGFLGFFMDPEAPKDLIDGQNGFPSDCSLSVFAGVAAMPAQKLVRQPQAVAERLRPLLQPTIFFDGIWTGAPRGWQSAHRDIGGSPGFRKSKSELIESSWLGF